jgi:membrane protease YdiL (CAAX protease family)
MRIVQFSPRPQRRPVALFGVAGFLLSLAVHALTFVGVAAQEYSGAVWALHIGVFPLFFPFVWQMRRWQEGRRLHWRQLLRYLPRWALVAAPALFVYTGVNFMLAMSHLPERSESSVAAGHVETHEERLYTVRAFSGHWLVFYALPTLFFLFVPAGARPVCEDDEPPGMAAA